MSDRDRPAPAHGESHEPERLTERARGTAERDPGRLLPSHATGGTHASTETYPPSHPAHDPRHAARWIAAALGLVLVYYAGMALHEQVQQRNRANREARMLTGGIPARGAALTRAHGCAGCHTIPGVPGANGLVGPSLAGVASRVYIGGVLTNTPDNLVRWLLDPKAVDPLTAMPDVGLDETQARHIAAYLYTLRE